VRATLSVALLAITVATTVSAVGLGGAVIAGAQAPARTPNELGRVMILQYHKIDNPEGRWTRTPENFKRDLARLWGRKEQTVRKWAMRARREGRAPHPDQVMTHRVNAARRYRLIRQDYAALLERVFFFRP